MHGWWPCQPRISPLITGSWGRFVEARAARLCCTWYGQPLSGPVRHGPGHAGKGSEIGDYLIAHPGVNAISFTGGDTGISICHKAGMVPIQASQPARQPASQSAWSRRVHRV